MARPLRVDFDGALYHVTSRGNAREIIFDEAGTASARIVQAMHRYGYSQREVADLLDLNYAAVGRLANRL